MARKWVPSSFTNPSCLFQAATRIEEGFSMYLMHGIVSEWNLQGEKRCDAMRCDFTRCS